MFEGDSFKMNKQIPATLRPVEMECQSIPVVNINNNRVGSAEERYEARMVARPEGVNNNVLRGGTRHCDFCVRSDKYTDKELDMHMKTNHNELLFKCTVCKSSFQNWLDALRHVRISHRGGSTKSVITPTDPENLLTALCKLKKCRRSFVSLQCKLIKGSDSVILMLNYFCQILISRSIS